MKALPDYLIDIYLIILITNSEGLKYYKLGMNQDFEEDQEQQYQKSFKIVCIGQSGVGKSTLIIRQVYGSYNPQQPTMIIDVLFKKVTHAGRSLKLQFWDTAGQQRYQAVICNYFRHCVAACVVFDLSNQNSLDLAKKWLQRLEQNCRTEIPKVLLGNKSDIFAPSQLVEQLEKYKQKIEGLKQQYKCEYFSVSAFSGQGISQAFAYLIQQIYQQHEANNVEDNNYKTSRLTIQKNVKLIGKETPWRMFKRCCLNR